MYMCSSCVRQGISCVSQTRTAFGVGFRKQDFLLPVWVGVWYTLCEEVAVPQRVWCHGQQLPVAAVGVTSKSWAVGYVRRSSCVVVHRTYERNGDEGACRGTHCSGAGPCSETRIRPHRHFCGGPSTTRAAPQHGRARQS